MHSNKEPNTVHELVFCKACKRITAQDVHFDLEERKHFVCCSCGHTTHTQGRPK